LSLLTGGVKALLEACLMRCLMRCVEIQSQPFMSVSGRNLMPSNRRRFLYDAAAGLWLSAKASGFQSAGAPALRIQIVDSATKKPIAARASSAAISSGVRSLADAAAAPTRSMALSCKAAAAVPAARRNRLRRFMGSMLQQLPVMGKPCGQALLRVFLRVSAAPRRLALNSPARR